LLFDRDVLPHEPPLVELVLRKGSCIETFENLINCPRGARTVEARNQLCHLGFAKGLVVRPPIVDGKLFKSLGDLLFLPGHSLFQV